MIVRSTLFSSPGGDTTQIQMTAKYLRELGVNVKIHLTTDNIDFEGYDVIHFFNIIRPDDILPHIDHHIPFVISTIYVDYSEYEKISRQGITGSIFKIFSSDQIEYIKAIGRRILNGDKIKSKYYLFRGHYAAIRKILKSSKMLLPNSHSEYRRLSTQYNISCNYEKVVNAIDPFLFSDTVQPNQEYLNHVISVGRIEGRKNQLNLIRAFENLDIPLTIIGKPSPNHIKYYQECKDLALKSKNIRIIEHVNHEDLAGIYKAAKVHVLPSWFETTGLSTLEAAAMCCNVVVTKKGDTEEYFSDFAFYCEPDSPASIKESVLKAYYSNFNPDFKNYILNRYTWNLAAQQTLNAYENVLKTSLEHF